MPYFADVHDHLANRLEGHFDRLRSGVPAAVSENIVALVLGGGYGRGEGGVMRGATGELGFANDLDYFLFSPEPDHPDLVAWVEQWELAESKELDIDVECVRLPSSKLEAPEQTMMFSDLAHGHHIVIGDGGVIAHWKAMLKPDQLPLAEAIRLLWNRGSGLFFAACELGEMEPDLLFVRRNHEKCKLALGDAIVCAHGQHSALARQRQRRLEQIDDDLLTPLMRQWHAGGVAYKLRPDGDTAPAEVLCRQNRDLAEAWQRVYLGLENRRLNPRKGFGIPEDYINYRGRLFPEEPVWRNLLLGLRDRLRRGGGLRPVWDYPRGGLYRLLMGVLSDSSIDDAITVRLLSEAKGQCSRAVLRRLYEKWWHHYS